MTTDTKVADLPAKWREDARVGVFTCGTGEAYRESLRDCADELESALAARQPVGQEPVAWIEARDLERLAEDDPEDPYAFEHVYPGPGEWGRRVPLYTAPPAHAVDLLEVNELLRIWQTHFDSGVRPDDDEPEDVELWDRIAAVRMAIDQQAGGEG